MSVTYFHGGEEVVNVRNWSGGGQTRRLPWIPFITLLKFLNYINALLNKNFDA